MSTAPERRGGGGARGARAGGGSGLHAGTAVGSAAPHWNHLRAIDPAWLRKLVIGDAIAPVAAEQYRRLAGAVHDLQVEHGLKTLMVTSAVPGEGKTLTIVAADAQRSL